MERPSPSRPSAARPGGAAAPAPDDARWAAAAELDALLWEEAAWVLGRPPSRRARPRSWGGLARSAGALVAALPDRQELFAVAAGALARHPLARDASLALATPPELYGRLMSVLGPASSVALAPADLAITVTGPHLTPALEAMWLAVLGAVPCIVGAPPGEVLEVTRGAASLVVKVSVPLDGVRGDQPEVELDRVLGRGLARLTSASPRPPARAARPPELVALVFERLAWLTDRDELVPATRELLTGLGLRSLAVLLRPAGGGPLEVVAGPGPRARASVASRASLPLVWRGRERARLVARGSARARWLLRVVHGALLDRFAELDPVAPAAPARALGPWAEAVRALLLTGRSNKEIALSLRLSPKTVERYVSRILREERHPNRKRLIAAAGRDPR